MSENEVVQFADVDSNCREKLAAIRTDRHYGFGGSLPLYTENGKSLTEVSAHQPPSVIDDVDKELNLALEVQSRYLSINQSTTATSRY